MQISTLFISAVSLCLSAVNSAAADWAVTFNKHEQQNLKKGKYNIILKVADCLFENVLHLLQNLTNRYDGWEGDSTHNNGHHSIFPAMLIWIEMSALFLFAFDYL